MPARAEIRIYPNLARERKNLAAMFLNRGAFGIHAQRQIGRGRDFEKLREYIHGDSIEDGRTGLLFRDPEEFRDRLMRLVAG